MKHLVKFIVDSERTPSTILDESIVIVRELERVLNDTTVDENSVCVSDADQEPESKLRPHLERLESIHDKRIKIGTVLTFLNQDGTSDGPFMDSIVIDKNGLKEKHPYIKVARPHAHVDEQFSMYSASAYTSFEEMTIPQEHAHMFGINLTGDSGIADTRIHFLSDGSQYDIYSIYCEECEQVNTITSQDERKFFPQGNYGKEPNQCPSCRGTHVKVSKTRLKSRNT